MFYLNEGASHLPRTAYVYLDTFTWSRYESEHDLCHGLIEAVGTVAGHVKQDVLVISSKDPRMYPHLIVTVTIILH